MKNFQRIIGVILVLSLFLIGCSSNDKPDPEDTTDPTNTTETEDNGDKDSEDGKSSSSLEADEEIAAKLEAEKDVESVMVQIETADEDNYVNVDIVLSEQVDGEKAAKKYADSIKEKYPDYIIDMILIHDDQIIYQNTFE